MHRLRWIVANGLLMLMMFAAADVPAAQPQYLILKSPTAPVHARAPSGAEHRAGIVVEAQPYAYGWFGAQPRRHWTRQFGYYRKYTQWSAK